MQDPSHNPAHIEEGKYQVEVLQGGTVDHFWYYMIRRKDSNKVIHLAKFDSYEKALEAARNALARMNLEATGS